MSKTLTEYEERAVIEIALWKAETPSQVSRALYFIRKPLNEVTGRVVNGRTARSLCARVEALVDRQSGRDEIARAAGVGTVEELAQCSLEECDQLAEQVSVHAQRLALLESTAAGMVGIFGAAVNVAVFLRAAIRAIRRIGHCYGYALATDRDRHYVLGVLELATAEEPEVRQSIRARLYCLMHDSTMVPLELDGVGRALCEDLVMEALPVLGEVAAVVLDYAFMRRIDIAARRVFQERWLRRRGKVIVIPPAQAGLRSQSLSVAWEATREVLYLGSYGLGFAATLPVAAAAIALKRTLPEPAMRGLKDGARDAVSSVDRLRDGVAGVSSLPAPRPAR
jgi:EcsC protein family